MELPMYNETDAESFFNVRNSNQRYKIILSLVLGLSSLVLSKYGFCLKVGSTIICIPWMLIVPIIISIAFGWRFGVLTALSGAAFIPFILYPKDVLLNLIVSFVFVSYFISIGSIKGIEQAKRGWKIVYRIIITLIIFYIIIFIAYGFLYGFLYKLNALYLSGNNAPCIESKYLRILAIKDCISLTLLTFLSGLFLRLPFIRRFFRLPVDVIMLDNSKIFYFSILSSIVIWLSFVGFELLFHLTGRYRDNHIFFFFFVLIIDGLIISRIIIYLAENSKLAQELLRQSEQSYIGLFNSVSEAIFIQNESGSFIDVNVGAEKMYGYSRSQIIGKTFEYISASEKNNLQSVKEKISAVFNSGNPQGFEFCGRKKDGDSFLTEFIACKGKYFGCDVLIVTARDVSASKKAEKEMKSALSMLMATLESTADGILVVDLNGNINAYNNKFIEIWKIPASVVASTPRDKDLVAFVLDKLKDPSEFMRVLSERYSKNESNSFDIIEFKDGRTIERYSILQRLDGKTIGRVWNFRDVTERNRKEQALKESNDRYENFVSHVSEGVFRFELDKPMSISIPIQEQMDYLYHNLYLAECNESFMQMLGIKDRNEVIGKKQVELQGENGTFNYRIIFKKFIEGNYAINDLVREIHTQSGEVRYYSNNAVGIVENGYFIRLWGTQTNVTERVKAEQELKESEERFKSVVDSAEEWIWEVDQSGIFTYSNYMVKKILGYEPDEIVGKMHFYDLFEQENRDSLLKNIFNGFEERIVFKDFINVNIHKNGDRVILKTSGSPIVDRDGNLMGYRGADSDITKQKLYEQALKESEERYRLTFMTSPDAIGIARLDGLFVDVNDGFTEFTGYERDDVIGVKSIDTDIWSVPGNRERLIKGLEKDGFVNNLESVIKCKDGTIKTALMSARIINFKDVPHVLAIARDITERKKLENALRQSEERFRMLFDKSSDAIFLINKARGECLNANKSAEDLTGYSLETMKDLKITQIVPDSSVHNLLKIGNSINENTYNEIAFLRTDGAKRFAMLNIIPVNNDEVYGIAHDITDRKKYEDTLRTFSLAVDQSPASIVITDMQGNIEYVNQKFIQLTGYSFNEVLGKNSRILKSGYTSKQEYKKMWSTIASGKEWHCEFYNVKKNGEKYWENALISPIIDDKGDIIKYVGVKEDVTEKKGTERKILSSIIETEERERSRFSRDLHDGLGPLLSTIKLYFEWLSEVKSIEKKKMILKNGTESIDEAIESIREISNNLSPRILNDFSIASALKVFINKINNTRKIFINFSYNTEIRFERNIEIMLYRIVTELINNTLKHAEASMVDVKLHLYDEKNYISLVYTDNGKGFDVSSFQREDKGLGFLSINQRVKTLDGKVFIENNKNGVGINILIELPLTNDNLYNKLKEP